MLRVLIGNSNSNILMIQASEEEAELLAAHQLHMQSRPAELRLVPA